MYLLNLLYAKSETSNEAVLRRWCYMRIAGGHTEGRTERAEFIKIFLQIQGGETTRHKGSDKLVKKIQEQRNKETSRQVETQAQRDRHTYRQKDCRQADRQNLKIKKHQFYVRRKT